MARAGSQSAGTAHDPLWYRDAIFYEVRVRAFYDSDAYQKDCKPLREGTGIYDIAFFESPPPASA